MIALWLSYGGTAVAGAAIGICCGFLLRKWTSGSETELRRLSRRHRALLKNASDGIHIIDITGDIIDASDSFCRMLGYTRAEMIGMNVVTWAPQFSRGELLAALARLTEQRWTWTFEVRYRRKNGTVFDTEVSCCRMELDGRLVVHSSARDITLRKHAEEDRRRLGEALRQCGEAIVVVDMTHATEFETHGIEYANPAFERLFGYSLEELRGHDTTMLLPDDPALRAANPIETGPFEGEKLRRAKDGRNIPVLLKAAPILDENGITVGIVAAMTDLSERKRAEQELRESKLAAESANRAKSVFLANMSHEIRTPLNVIIGLASIPRRGAQDGQDGREIDQLEKIDQAANHLLTIINDVLDMSKIEAGKLSINPTNFSLRTLLSRMYAHFLPEAGDKGLELGLEIDPDIPAWLRGDDLRLKQCLFNYVSNAVKFTPGGSVTIRAVLERPNEAGLVLRFDVIDSGIGIEPEMWGRLFTPFQQVDMSITRQFGGTGLGLALTKQLAALLGGEVGVDSIPGRGSRFWFTVVLQPVAEISAGVEEEDKERTPAPAHNFSGVRVLVVEDVEVNRQVVKRMLEKLEVVVDTAENGQIAVEMASTDSFALILMDMRMPVMDGLSATRIIRRLSGYSATPIIALTANAFDEDRQACLDAGMSDYLTKPLRGDTLITTLSKWLAPL